nr:MAG TPA: hypothetical protein [Caudoviricetes sp.]
MLIINCMSPAPETPFTSKSTQVILLAVTFETDTE